MTRRRAAGISLVVSALLVAGCSSSTTGGGATSSSSTSSSVPAPSSSSAAETITQAEAQAALLTPAEVGAKFAQAAYTPQDQQAPCGAGGPALEDAVPQTLRVGATIVSVTLKASFSEELFAYPDADHAAKALAFLEKGVTCKSGKLPLASGGLLPVTIGAVQDVTAQLRPARKAVAVQVDSSITKIVLAAAQLGRLMVVFTFAAFKSTPDSALPNPIGLAAKAVTKVAKS